MELNQLTITQALTGLQKKNFLAVELTQACLKRIKEVEPKVNAFITVCEKEALEEAKKVDTRILGYKDTKSLFGQYPLLGIPIGVKDNFCTEGVKSTAASRVLGNYLPVYDATVVRRLKEAGAIILGKTNMDAWAHGSSTEASDFFTTKNPWDLNRLPGGSSGGSAAAVIADEVIGAIGSETAGSIRQPAAWCGIVGFKPTYGRVSRYGLMAMASSLDSPGPLTKTVEDAALILRVLAAKDEMDATTSSKEVPDFLQSFKKFTRPRPPALGEPQARPGSRDEVGKGLKSLRVGVPKEYFFKGKGMDRKVVKTVRTAIGILEKAGGKIREVTLLDPKYSVAVYTIIQRSEVSSNLARYDGIRYGKDRTHFGEEAKRRMMFGTYTLSFGYYDQYYLKAQKVRTLICRDLERVFKQVDVLVAPTSPTPALKIGASADEPMFGEMQDILVEASTLAGLPGVNLPCGFSKEGLPIGMQIIGPQFSEELLFQVGYAYEQATDWHKRRPKL